MAIFAEIILKKNFLDMTFVIFDLNSDLYLTFIYNVFIKCNRIIIKDISWGSNNHKVVSPDHP